MNWFYNVADIELGPPAHYGHETYIDAVHTPSSAHGKPSKIIFKKNKYGKAQFSRFEVAFTQLAQLLLARATTSPQRLVVDDSFKVVGLASQHLCYAVEKKEGLSQTFFILDNPHLNCNCTAKKATQAEEIPYYFLDKLPQGFFARLLQAEKENTLSIDYDSLASILATSYTLEEDDLHKGNFGFYIVEKAGNPHVVFFKIDHDLMFSNSLMSFKAQRFFHWMRGDHAFDIMAEDLVNFPCLTHSANFYWPTKFSYFSKPWSNKEYHSFEEVEAFALLGRKSEFKKAKWMAFYKHILLPEELIELSLKQGLDKDNPKDRAQIALIAQATIARQAQLRAVLFSIKEFRDFVSDLKQEEHESLLNELLESIPQATIPEHSKHKHFFYQALCQSEQGFEQGDTPLHVAIKLGDYRYEETMHLFGHCINKKNDAGKTPLDVALEKAEIAEEYPNDLRKDLRFIMRHLGENGAKKRLSFPQYDWAMRMEPYQFQNFYIDLATQARSYQQFKEVLRDIGEDHRFCLKFQKNIAIACVAQFILVNKEHPDLRSILLQLKQDLNGRSPAHENAGLKYIRQLRSKLWLIRLFRGLYGQTSTLSELNAMIDKELGCINTKEPNCFSFFSSGADPKESNEEVPCATEHSVSESGNRSRVT